MPLSESKESIHDCVWGTAIRPEFEVRLEFPMHFTFKQRIKLFLKKCCKFNLFRSNLN